MNKKVVCIILLTALLVATGVVLAGPGEDSDLLNITITASHWETLFSSKEGGEEGIFLCWTPGEDSD